MNEADLVAVVLFVGVTAYALFGGADFGAGFWDLIAGGADRGERPRALVDHSIGPVWEANHVWLIFCLVVLWTAFSEAFASIMLTLFVPLTLAALGIVMRGSSFAFRKSVLRTRDRRTFGAIFAVSSVLVPYCMGAVAGAIASGRVPSGGKAGDAWDSWVNPTSILGGVLAVAACAYLASVYLVWDARRLDDSSMVEYFRRRAVVAAIVVGVIAFAGIFVLHSDATLPLRRPHVARRSRSSSSPGCAGSGRSFCSCAMRTPAPRAPRDRRGGDRHLGLGRRAVAVHPARDAEGRAGRGTVGDADRGAGGVRPRGGPDPAVARPAVRAGPEEPPERRHLRGQRPNRATK